MVQFFVVDGVVVNWIERNQAERCARTFDKNQGIFVVVIVVMVVVQYSGFCGCCGCGIGVEAIRKSKVICKNKERIKS